MRRDRAKQPLPPIPNDRPATARYSRHHLSHIMKTLPISDIIIPPGRQRENVPDGHIGTLLESIFGSAGLLNPIVIEAPGTLVAGECRLRAIKLGYMMSKNLYHAGLPVPAGHVPVTEFKDLPPLQRMEIEYAENAYRKDLDWQENVRALDALAKLRTAQAEAAGQPKPIFKDIAQEVFKRSDGDYTGKVSSSVIVAKHLADPAIAGAKSLKEAVKILTRRDEADRRVRLAEMVGKQSVSERFTAIHGESLAEMAKIADATFDVILTDPPYGMGADTFGDAAGKMTGIDHQYIDDEDSTKILLAQAIPEFFRLAKPEAHLYLWCDLDLFHWLRAQCVAAGWWTHRTPLVNVKPDGGRVPWPENGPRRSYELVLYAVKGKKPVTGIRNDTFETRMPEGNLGHGAQKPVEAYVELLKRSVRPGDKVLDAFAGSGTIFPAAAEVQCSATGIEMSAHAYGICLERIEGLK